MSNKWHKSCTFNLFLLQVATQLFMDYGFVPQIVRKQAIVPAKEGRVVYKAIAIDNFNPTKN